VREVVMTIRFLGVDPDSEHGGSPTVWDDGDCLVVQGWRVTDEATLAEIGAVPAHETVVRIPERMLPFFAEVSSARNAPSA
jgi:hypothetical protein